MNKKNKRKKAKRADYKDRPIPKLEKDPPALDSFKEVWAKLMTTPIHLDSALSKLNPKKKTILAQVLPRILAQPLSLCEYFGIGVTEGEPWSLSREELKSWRPAILLAERMMASMDKGIPQPKGSEYDFPPEMVAEWKADWGDARVKELCASLVISPPIGLRVSTKTSREKVLADLKKGSDLPVKTTLSTATPFGIRLETYAPIMKTAPFVDGVIEIQDEGSQWMAVFAMDPERYGEFLSDMPKEPAITTSFPKMPKPASMTIVDACSGAGGKALALADILDGKGRVYGYDVFESKVAALKKRAKRSKLNNIQAVWVKEGDEEASLSQHMGSADLVLVDAPCSGWGVLKRNPDIKWRTHSADLKRMPELQLRLLSLYSKLVKPGGKLVYGLCTFRKIETQQVVDAFLKKNPEWKPTRGGYYGPGRTDGFYMHGFVRKT
jgi:16S rRNA C967 or C1407 C5-methylase (RsmB/RsmF family)